MVPDVDEPCTNTSHEYDQRAKDLCERVAGELCCVTGDVDGEDSPDPDRNNGQIVSRKENVADDLVLTRGVGLSECMWFPLPVT